MAVLGTRRAFLTDSASLACFVGTFGSMALPIAAAGSQEQAKQLDPEEKRKLKEELQRELERRVYSVDEALFKKINRAADPANLVGHERSHVPKIIAPSKVRRLERFPVKIEVGPEELHEMTAFHYIDWISLDIDSVQAGFASLAPIFCTPVLVFELTLEQSATLTAQEHCNLHGTWQSEPVIVEVA